MKKTLTALATLGMAGLASGQSSVTLFGVIDASIGSASTRSVYYNNVQPLRIDGQGRWSVNPATIPPASGTGTVGQRQRALSSSSRMGFRGTEDLGGGLAASFWLESDIRTDDGSVGLTRFSRRSTVSLSGGFGELRLGRDYTATFWNDSLFDPFYVTGIGASLIGRIGGALSTVRGPGSVTSALDNFSRANNSVSYYLPAGLGGFYGQLQYALPEQDRTSASNDAKGAFQAASSSAKGRYMGGRFGYANGPLDVALAYGESTAVDTATPVSTTDRKLKTLNAGMSYDFGPVKLMGELSQVRDELTTGTTTVIARLPVFTQHTSADKYNGAMIAAVIPIDASTIRLSYGRVKFNNATPPAWGSGNTTTDQFVASYAYSLSRRTSLYATFVRIRVKDGYNSPLMGATTTNGAGGTPAFLITGKPTTSGYMPSSATGYNVGIRHVF